MSLFFTRPGGTLPPGRPQHLCRACKLLTNSIGPGLECFFEDVRTRWVAGPLADAYFGVCGPGGAGAPGRRSRDRRSRGPRISSSLQTATVSTLSTFQGRRRSFLGFVEHADDINSSRPAPTRNPQRGSSLTYAQVWRSQSAHVIKRVEHEARHNEPLTVNSSDAFARG
jgi:hypothetical protein